MNRALLLALAACGTHKPPEPTRMATTSAPATTTASPKSAYHLPAATVKALAGERVTGQVLVGALETLYATEAAARAHAGDVVEPSIAVAYTVRADHGDVIELATKPAEDCVLGFEPPYELTVFVPRRALMLRLDAGRLVTFRDGTAAAVDRGAPVWVGKDGLGWEADLLATPGLAPDPAHLRYGIDGPFAQTTLPALGGERLVCDDGIKTLAQWRGAQPRDKYDLSPPDERFAPYCGVVDPSRGYPEGKASPPQLDGRATEWPSWRERANDRVVLDRADSYLGDVEVTCGRVRLRVEAGGVRDPGAAGAAGGRVGKVWTPKPGPVTWRDGSPAGTFLGNHRYRDRSVEQVGDRICVAINNIAERVCFPAKSATVETDAFGGFSDLD